VLISICGCSPGRPISGQPGITVTFTFINGTPTAAATQITSGSFTPATITSGKLTLTVGNDTTKFAVAYACPPVSNLGTTVNNEFVVEATAKDGTAFTVSCLGQPATGSATGSADATAIPGATDVKILGIQGIGGNVGSASGSFNLNLPTGSNDVAAVAVDASGNVLAVKILRAQTVPGAINSGAQMVFAPGDQVSTQSLVVNNVPAGDVSPPAASVEYITAKGTVILLSNNSATSYPGVPAGATQAGDFYLYESNTNDVATHKSSIGVTQTTTSGGGFQTLVLPTPWSFSGPAAAVFPTFTFNYTDFNALAAVAQQAKIQWIPAANTVNSITVTATASFQNGANTITIPNLTSLSGFIPAAPTSTTITWVADIFGGTGQQFAFFPTPPPNSTVSFVQNQGTFTQP
jgi:hypothetical protein